MHLSINYSSVGANAVQKNKSMLSRYIGKLIPRSRAKYMSQTKNCPGSPNKLGGSRIIPRAEGEQNSRLKLSVSMANCKVRLIEDDFAVPSLVFAQK